MVKLSDMKECYICQRPHSEEHHRIYRSECKPLEKCKPNLVYLCHDHHRSTYGVHGKHGENLNKQLKLEFQNWLEIHLLKTEYTQEELQKILGISSNAIKSLCKLMNQHNGVYERENIIIKCMGGKKYYE